MIGIITNALKEKAVSELSWAERVGGLATVASQPIMTTIEGEQKKVGEYLFPITNDLEGRECWEKGQYFNLLPGSAYKSVIYFEQITPIRQEREVFASATINTNPKFKKLIFTTTIRMVVWLNLEKLGWENPGFADFATTEICKKFLQSLSPDYAGKISIQNEMITNADLFLNIQGIPPRDAQIFNKYSISSISENLIYPFEFFAIDFDCKFVVGKDCIIDPEVMQEIC